MHGAHRWPTRLVLHDLGGDAGKQEDHNDRKTGAEWHVPPAPASVHRARLILTSQFGLPSTNAKGTTKISTPTSSLTWRTQSRQSFALCAMMRDRTTPAAWSAPQRECLQRRRIDQSISLGHRSNRNRRGSHSASLDCISASSLRSKTSFQL
jgi:hypothetical protein